MRYAIRGADRETGSDIELTTEANSEAEAREWANRRGILVSEVVAMAGKLAKRNQIVHAPPPIGKVQTRAAVIEAPPPAAQAPQIVYVHAPAPAAPVVTQTVNVHQAKPGGIARMALLCSILALLFCWVPAIGLIAASLAVLFGIFGIIAAALGTKGAGYSIIAILIALVAFVPATIFTGAGLAGMGASAAASRDAARRDSDRQDAIRRRDERNALTQPPPPSGR